MIKIEAPDTLTKQQRIIASQLTSWISAAVDVGLVVTVEQRSRRPLAMGNYETVVAVRQMREVAA